MKQFWRALAFVVAAIHVVPVRAADDDLSGLRPPPGDVRPPAVPYDPQAVYCTAEENRDDPSGRITMIAGLAMHVCRGRLNGPDGPPANERLRVNHARVPGLTFAHFSGAMSLDGGGDGDLSRKDWMDFERRRLPVLARHERFSGVLYEVWHDPAPKIFNRDLTPWVELFGPQPYPHGNLYRFVPEPGTAGLPWHFVYCHAEPLNAWRDEPVLCFVYVHYKGRAAYVKLFGSGPGYAEGSGYARIHPFFPHYARDLWAVLFATDATDDPARVACVQGGGAWSEGKCDDGP